MNRRMRKADFDLKIGVYGGTFNPIHLAHIHILEGFSKRLKLEKILIIPTFTPPHKEAPELAAFEDRFRMCALAAESLEGISTQVLDLEKQRGGKSYTYQTLEELKKGFPDDELFFITGEDMFLTLDTWKRFDIISKLAVLCASPRSEDGYMRLVSFGEMLKAKYGAEFVIEKLDFLDISSTEIRENIKQGSGVSDLVPAKVEQYIIENKIYK